MRQEETLLISKESRDNLVTFLNNLVVAMVTTNDPVPLDAPAPEEVIVNPKAVQSAPKKRGRKPKIRVQSEEQTAPSSKLSVESQT